MRILGVVVVVALGLAGCSDMDASADADFAAQGSSTTTTTAPSTTEPSTTAEPGTATEPGNPDDVPADPSAGCGTAPDVEPVGAERPGDVEQAFATPTGERVYRLGVPAGYDPEVPAPLVVNLHGSGSDATQASTYGDVPRRASARGVITVAPQAIDG